jgi:rubrerythrin
MDETAEEIMIIRDILMREIETINVYQRMAASTESPDVAGFLHHIIEEEKEHVAEALELIKRYDPSQAELLASQRDWRHAGGSKEDSSSYGRDNFLNGHTFTVGALRKR